MKKTILWTGIFMLASVCTHGAAAPIEETGASRHLFPSQAECAAVFQDNAQQKLVLSLIENARQGDSKAYGKLAKCYQYGKGVKRSFLKMLLMLLFAQDYGGKKVEDAVKEFAPEDPSRIFFKAMYHLDRREYKEVESAIRLLQEKKYASHYTLNALLAKDKEDDSEYQNSLQKAIEQGCEVALMIQATELERKKDWKEYEKFLTQHAAELPFFYNLLGKLYLEAEGESQSEFFHMGKAMKAFYLADEQAFLTPANASRLLTCYEVLEEEGNPLPNEAELNRLSHLASFEK